MTSSRTKGAAIVSAQLLAACGGEIPILPHVEGAGGVVLLVESESVSAFANEIGPKTPGLRIEAPRESELFALYYPRAPLAYGLPPGRLALASSIPSRALPVPFATFRAIVSGDVGDWEASSAGESQAYRTLRLPIESPGDCLLRYGCYAPEDLFVCQEPCPAPPTPLPPTATPKLPDLLGDDGCPDGWMASSREIGGLVAGRVPICEPLADTDPDCAVGSAPFPRQGGCAIVGDPCPADGWVVPPGGRALHVRSGPSGGDGSRARPYGRLDAAFLAAARGDWVVLAPGDYAAPSGVPPGVSLAGACTASVAVSGGSAILLRSGTSIRGIRFEALALEIQGEAEPVTLDGAVINAPGTVTGIAVRSGRAILRSVAIRSGSTGARVEGSASLVAQDLVVRAPEGLIAAGNATGTVGASLFEVERGPGLHVTGGSLVAREIVIGGDPAYGVLISGGTALVEDIVIRGPTGGVDSAIFVDGGTVRLTRARTKGLGHGISVHGTGSLEVRDSVVAESDITGINMAAGRVVARRVLLTGAGGFISVLAEGTPPNRPELDLEDVQIIASRGTGLSVSGFGQLTARVLSVIDSGATGISSAGNAADPDAVSIDMVDVEVLRSRSEALSLDGVRRIRIERVSIRSSRGSSFQMGGFNVPTHVEATHLQITGSGPAGDSGCRTAADCSGVGVTVRGGRLDLMSFDIRNHKLANIVVAAGGEMSANNGTLAESPIGFRLFDTERDVSGLMMSVRIDPSSVAVPCEPCGPRPSR